MFPNYVQVGGTDSSGNMALHIAHPDRDLRYHQRFALARLVAQAQTGSISPADGIAELDRIRALPMRFPAWVSVIGYAVQSAGLALILQPAPWALAAALGLGLVVGLLTLAARNNDALEQLLPIIGAFVVAVVAFAITDLLHLGSGSLRVLIAPLAYFLPGAAITLAVIELSTHQVISGSSRLIAGFMRIAQLAFGILIAAQVTGIGDSNLNDTVNNHSDPGRRGWVWPFTRSARRCTSGRQGDFCPGCCSFCWSRIRVRWSAAHCSEATAADSAAVWR